MSALLSMFGINGDDVESTQAALLLALDQLAAIHAAVEAQGPELAISNQYPREHRERDFPTAGRERVIVHRHPDHRAIPVASTPAAGTAVCDANPRRIGLNLVNTGAVPVTLVLTDNLSLVAPEAGLWLAAAGGSWDGTLGPYLWTGAVSAIADAGGPCTLALVEG